MEKQIPKKIQDKLAIDIDYFAFIETENELETFNQYLQEAVHLSFDFETTGTNIVLDEEVGIGLQAINRKGKSAAVYIPFQHIDTDCLPKEKIMDLIRPKFEDPNILITAHNLKFDIQFLWDNNIDLTEKIRSGKVADTIIMYHLLNVNTPMSKLSLEHLFKKNFKIKLKSFEEVVGDLEGFHHVPKEEAIFYAGLDPVACYELYNHSIEELKEQKLDNVFWNQEMVTTHDLAKMKRRGIDVDEDLLQFYKKRADKELEELKSKIVEITGRDLNLNSPQQVKKLLFEDWNAPVLEKTETGNPSTNQDVIAQLSNREDHIGQFAQLFARYKELSSLDSKYLSTLPEQITPDGKIHCNLNQVVTRTGRLSSSKPNLQNQPRDPAWIDEYEVGKEYKPDEIPSSEDIEESVVIPDNLEEAQKLFPKHKVEFDGDNPDTLKVHLHLRDAYYNRNGVLLVIDYEQMEFRIMAHFSKDKHLLDGFNEGLDIHTYVASKAFDVPYEEVTKDQRQNAKAVGFGTIFGKSAYGFALDWYSHYDDCVQGFFDNGMAKVNQKYLDKTQKFLDKFFNEFKGIKNYMNWCHAYARKYGYIRTMTGRKRPLQEIWSNDKSWRNTAKRRAVNTRIQGCLNLNNRVWVKGKGYKKLKDMIGEGTFEVWDGSQFSEAQAMFSGYKRKVKIELANGQEIECSPDHKFLTVNTNGNLNFKTADEFNKVEKIRLSGEVEDEGKTKVDLKTEIDDNSPHNLEERFFDEIEDKFVLGQLLGRLASDGYVRSDKSVTWVFSEHEEIVGNFIKNNLPWHYSNYRKSRENSKDDCNRTQYVENIVVNSKLLAAKAEEMKIGERIPEVCWSNKELLRGYLSGYFDGDGGLSGNKIVLTFGRGKEKKKHAQDIQEALGLFGLQTRLRHYPGKRTIVAIRKRDNIKFLERIGFINQVKNEKVAKAGNGTVRNNLQGRVETVKKVTVTDEYIPMGDIINSDTSKFMTKNLVTHNSAADFIKIAQSNVEEALEGTPIDPVLQVHDEIVYTVPSKEMAEEVVEDIEEIMNNAVELNVKIESDSDIVTRWGMAK